MALLALLLALTGPAEAPGWEREVERLAPVLRACLEGRPGAMVVEAWEGPAGPVARLLLPGGAREDCEAGRWRAVDPADRRPGEGLRAFMLERRCVDAWRVADGQGRELGWLAYPGCG